MEDGTIRGEILIGGWHFEHVGPKKTKTTNYMINDYKGNLSKIVLNLGAPTQAQIYTNMKKAMAVLEAEGKL